ncbi:MAG: tyrosine-type recombinase/integrase [Flavobacteriaceae bacterium]|nr:MAG: tyrosine-type recombinase/integrase [Flavobacteriaceae bacterium]
MSVNLRTKYIGNKNNSRKNRPYRKQLDYTLNGKRVRETIKEVTFNTTDTKEVRKQKERLVENIRAKLEIELGNAKNGLVSRQLQKANFILYFEKLGNKKSEKTKTAWDNTLKHLIKFQGKKLTFENISVSWIENFIEYLKSKELANNSIVTYTNKINATLNQAIKEKIIVENPIRFIERPKKKETEIVFLTKDEIQKIISTDFWDNDSKNAFLFSCYSGLRASDIKNLKWSNIKDNRIQLIQNKTKNTVYIPLNNNARNILNKQTHNEEFVFNLSDHISSMNRTVKKLIKLTGIDKKVHFHCARHTFATLLVTAGVNIFTISKLMGHKDIKSTLVYAKVIDEEKQKAVNSMVNLEFYIIELQEVKKKVEYFEDRILHNFETHFSYLVLDDFYGGGHRDRISGEWFYDEYFEQYENDIIELLLKIEHKDEKYYDFQLRLIKLKRIIDTKLSKIENNNDTTNPLRINRKKSFLLNPDLNKKEFINFLYKVLIKNKLIDEKNDDFKFHFENQWDKKIQWLGTEFQITNLIDLLIENNYLNNETKRFRHQLVIHHFINKNGEPFKNNQLSKALSEDKHKAFEYITNDIIDEISTTIPLP